MNEKPALRLVSDSELSDRQNRLITLLGEFVATLQRLQAFVHLDDAILMANSYDDLINLVTREIAERIETEVIQQNHVVPRIKPEELT